MRMVFSRTSSRTVAKRKVRTSRSSGATNERARGWAPALDMASCIASMSPMSWSAFA
jgi:hypothetical protein